MPRPADPRCPGASWTYRLFARVFFTVMDLQRWRFEVRGLANVPRVGGAVIAANHTSFWDFYTTGRGPYLQWGRPVRILAKASLFDLPVVGRIMRSAGHIPVRRGSGAGALSHAVRALLAGELVLVLPEQTISPAFELLPFKRGAVRMAAEARVPLVPAVSWGTHRFHTVGRRPRWCWRLPVTVRFGEPMYPTLDDDMGATTTELERRVRELLAAVQRDYPDGTPAGAWWVPARLGGGAPTAGAAAAHVRGVTGRWQQSGPSLSRRRWRRWLRGVLGR